MSQPFSFPPPPPPPPRTESIPPQPFTHPNYASQNGPGARDRGDGYSRGRGRGEPFWGRDFSSGGRGSRGTHRGDYGRGSFNHNSNGFGQYSAVPQTSNQHARNSPQSFPAPYHGQKRAYSAAFNKPTTALSRPQAAPAVPSFGGAIPPPPNSPPTSSAARKKPRKRNQLGLTPVSQDHESSSDEDEEAKLAISTAPGTGSNSAVLQIEYKGRTATLQTAADIAAWIAERKKNFPTAAKAEAAKKEAEEKRRKWAETKKERAEAQRLQRLDRDKARQDELRKRALESMPSKKTKREEDKQNMLRNEKEEGKATKAAQKTEKLKRRLEKAQRDARRAEEALARMQKRSTTISSDHHENANTSQVLPTTSPAAEELAPPPSEADGQQQKLTDDLAMLKAEILKDEDDTLSIASITSSDLLPPHLDSSSEPTSSSGSSSSSSSSSDLDSDAVSAPEELTSRRTAPARIPPPPRLAPHLSTSNPTPGAEEIQRLKNPCRNLLRTGHCQFGTRCRYSHDLSRRGGGGGGGGEGDAGRERNDRIQGPRRESSKPQTGRKGLYQILVEKEVQEERRAVVRVIMEMGGRGLLGEVKGIN